MPDEVYVFREDWSLHPKGQEEKRRHQAKVKEAIQKRLVDLVHDESFILSDGKTIVKIPVQTLDEIHFRFDEGKNEHVGQGSGGTRSGDVVARGGADGGGGKGEAGDAPGVDYIEAEVSLEDVEAALFAEFVLPNLKPKGTPEDVSAVLRFNDLRKKGIWANLDKRRTMLNVLRRTQKGKAFEGGAALGSADDGGGFGGLQDGARPAASGRTPLQIHADDLRFRTWDDDVEPETRAVVLAMMDTSGSMGAYEKYMARVFYFWMTRFLKTRYARVERVYIAHHTEARVVDEATFFQKGESGGTICSSAYDLALKLIDERYPPERYNIYPFHFTDGDNLLQDHSRALERMRALVDRSNLVGYAEINHVSRRSTLYETLAQIESPAFRMVRLQDKTDLYSALKRFFSEHRRSGA